MIGQKIQDYQQHILWLGKKMTDVRAIGLSMFVVIVLLVSWSGAKVIDTNYKLQKQISTLQQQNDVQKLANTNLDLQNKYLNTTQYLELSARQNFGLAAPGETVLVVPKDVALAHTVALPASQSPATPKSQSQRPAYQRNFQAWMNFFLHRPQTVD